MVSLGSFIYSPSDKQPVKIVGYSFSVKLAAAIKDDSFNIPSENVEFRRNAISFHYCHCNCECWTCHYYIDYVNKCGNAFFRDLRQQHYHQLMMQVFIPLSNLRSLEFQPIANRRALSPLRITIPNASAFYSDGKRHLSKRTKRSIEMLSKRLTDYNNKVDSLNPVMTSRINEIINSPMPGPLNERYVPGLYRIVSTAFAEVILTSDGEVENVFKSHDMAHKVNVNGTGAYGFGGEEQKVINMLKDIEASSEIREDLQTLRNMIIDIRHLTTDIGSEASGIIQEIAENRYRF